MHFRTKLDKPHLHDARRHAQLAHAAALRVPDDAAVPRAVRGGDDAARGRGEDGPGKDGGGWTYVRRSHAVELKNGMPWKVVES